MNYITKLTVALSVLLSTVSAMAATTDAVVNQTVTTTETAETKTKKLPISLNDYSFFFGPSMNAPISNKTADAAINQTTGLSSLHYVTLTYTINEMLRLAPVAEFSYTFTDPNGTGADRFTLSDPFLKLSASNLLEKNIRNSGNILMVDADLRYYAPVSKRSSANNSAGTVRLSVNPALQFANSDFSISSTNYIKYWIQPDSGRIDETTGAEVAMPLAKLYTGPQVNYRMNNRVTAFALFEAALEVNTTGAANIDDDGTSAADVQPGFEIKVVDNFTLVPYLNWYINQPLKTTSVNLNADITLF